MALSYLLSYFSRMKRKISITLSAAVLEEIDRISGSRARSRVIEEALTGFLRARRRADIEQRDARVLEERAEAFSEFALDVLEFQVLQDPSADPS